MNVRQCRIHSSQEFWGSKWCQIIDQLVVIHRENCTAGRTKRNVDLVCVVVIPSDHQFWGNGE